MQALDIRKLRFREVVENHKRYDFGVFIELMRKTLGLKRREVCEALDFSQSYLFNLERGFFKLSPASVDIIMLADFYGVDSELLKDKLNYFMLQGKNIPRHMRKKEGLSL